MWHDVRLWRPRAAMLKKTAKTLTPETKIVPNTISAAYHLPDFAFVWQYFSLFLGRVCRSANAALLIQLNELTRTGLRDNILSSNISPPQHWVPNSLPFFCALSVFSFICFVYRCCCNLILPTRFVYKLIFRSRKTIINCSQSAMILCLHLKCVRHRGHD